MKENRHGHHTVTPLTVHLVSTSGGVSKFEKAILEQSFLGNRLQRVVDGQNHG